MAQNHQIYHFYLDFWVENVLFKSQYLKKSLGNIPSKFPHEFFLSLGIEKQPNLCWRSFFKDGIWLNLLCTYLPSYNVARKRTINQLTNRRLPSPITKVTFCCIVAFKNKTILALEQSSSSMFSVRNLHNHKEKNKINIAAQNNLIFIHQKIVLKLAKYLPWKALEELK